MKSRMLTSTLIAITLAGCAEVDTATVPGFDLVQTVESEQGEINIPFKKFTLENGLTVVLHQDKSDPLVHVDVTYHVGSGREDIGKSGFAHFFEHMMFQGSENVADEQHFKIITEAGGTLNGTTNSDRTNYFETVPSNQLEKMLWLEADRMGYFLNAVTQEKFEVQRETVKNERSQRVDNQPYGLLYERIGEAMFPEGHPYSWSTIGYIEDLNRATLNDLKKFFLKWYGPNNAVITVGGDFDETQTLEWIKKYFGPIPTGAAVNDPVYTPVTLDENRYISLEDNVQLPLLYMAWPTVHLNHPDEAPLDVLMSIMGSGKTSLLYKNLEIPGLAVQANAGHACEQLHCNFTLLALANPARVQSLSEIEDVFRASLEEFEGRGVEDDDIIRVKSQIVSGMIYGLGSVSGKVSQLAAYETYRDNPNGIGDDIARYEGVTKADVMRVYAKYIKDKPSVVMSIVPKGQAGMVTKPDSWQRYERNIPEDDGNDDFNWSLPEDNFDRSVLPPSGANPSIKVPEIYKDTLSNGVEILGSLNTEIPTTTINLNLEVGQNYEDLDKLGLASLTAEMMNEATQKSSAEDLSNRLAKLGSSISFSSGNTQTTLSVRSLTRHLDKTLSIAAEKLLLPKFDPKDFARVKDNAIQGIKASKKQPSRLASEAFSRKLFGDNNSFAYGNAGTVETVSALSLDDVNTFYKTYYSPQIARIVAVSDLGQNSMKKSLSVFSEWDGDTVEPAQEQDFPDLGKTVIYFLDKPDAAQSEIRIGKRALPYDATGEYFKSGLMNYSLGGAFNSRINLNLREDKGYTYGARTSFGGNKTRGTYIASAGVKSDATAASITEFLNEINSYHADGISEAELDFTKNAIGQKDARAYETPRQKLGFLSRMQTYDLSPDFVTTQSEILSDISKAELDALADKHLDIKDMIILVVGDKKTVMPQLEGLDIPVIEIDNDGQALK